MIHGFQNNGEGGPTTLVYNCVSLLPVIVLGVSRRVLGRS